MSPGDVANQLFKSQSLSGNREGRSPDEMGDEVAVDESGVAENVTAAPTDHLVPGTLIEMR